MHGTARLTSAAIAACLGVLFASLHARAQDPLKVAPSMYKKLTENDRVRIMEVTFKPGETIPVHSHPDHAAIAITDGKLAITAGGRTQEAELKAGQALWTPAESHAATNIGKTTLRLVVIELKEGAKK